ncbi:uncharacterized protein SETTUDRAFT_28213 [Exserohilum turcica Et28A]|uniref:Uncharacterized protein n=1 Tax=Exserohilum turcicum (strain 28A) TaxID=671987 RepID=R0IRS9_EXST2|nr:uncharacterized protein SETTUDRAFT_28213 [Exserohilum turcica Et28A]EOA87575.1 hypothetical protein SETTUDRAFT_28213 [Exserohilum turcica Et28A]
MPFRDEEWEELQRDCDIFPAYSDYLYGPDKRLVVTQEPGLHPLVYPVHAPQTVRYATKKASRSGLYRMVHTGLPNAASIALQSSSNDGQINGNVNKNIDNVTPGVDVLSQTAMSVDPSPPSRALRTVSEKEEAKSQAKGQQRNHRQSKSAPSQNAGSKPTKADTQWSQSKNSTKHSTPTAQEPPQTPHLHSSSATDVKEEPIHTESHQKLSGTSTPASTLSIPLHSGFPSMQHVLQVAMLQPDDIVRDPRYLCFNPQERDQIRNYLSACWHIASHHPDSNQRAEALLSIRSFSMTVRDKTKSVEAGVVQPGSGQTTMNVSGSQVQRQESSYQQQSGRMEPVQDQRKFSQPCSSPAFASTQPAFPYPTGHKPSQQTGQSLCHMTVNSLYHLSKQSQPQVTQYGHTSPSKPPSGQQSPTSARDTAAIPSQASAQLRATLNRYIPQVWQCLVLTNQDSKLTTEADVQKRERAQQWLTAFKSRLSEEGRMYMARVVNWMYGERTAGRDPMASLKARA